LPNPSIILAVLLQVGPNPLAGGLEGADDLVRDRPPRAAWVKQSQAPCGDPETHPCLAPATAPPWKWMRNSKNALPNIPATAKKHITIMQGCMSQ